MKDLSERLWPAFRAEVAEQLDALELLVVQRAEFSAGDVNAMFRHFHTIKGGCAMMGFASMGALAHAAEDALDPVRRQERVLDASLVDALLCAIDAIKAQLQEVESTRRDPAPNAALVARLREPAASLDVRQAPGFAAGAPAVSAVTECEAFFSACEPVAQVLLAMALQPALPAGAGTVVEDVRRAADHEGLYAISRLLAVALAAGEGGQRRRAVAEAWERITELEAHTGRDAGTRAALAADRDRARQHLNRALAESGAALASLDAASGGAAAALARVDALLTAALLLQLKQTSRLVRLSCQVLREIVRRGLRADDRLLELVRLACALPGDLQEDLQEDGPYCAMCASIFQRLKQAVGDVAEGQDPSGLRARLAARVQLDRDWLDALSMPALARLEAALAAGDTVAELEADMEAAPDGGAALVDWLDDSGTRIGNRTVFRRERTESTPRETTRLCFLACWPLPPEDIRRALDRLDPSRRLFTLRVCEVAGAQPAATPTPEGESVASHDRSAAAVPAPAEPGRAAAMPGAESRAQRNQQTLRIDSDVVDQFVNRIGELVTLRNMMAHVLQSEEVNARHRRARALLGQGEQRPLASDELSELRDLLGDLDEQRRHLQQTDMRIQGALGRMQEEVLALRVVPMAMVFNRLPRVIRDLGQAQGKSLQLDVSGDDVRVDKGLVDVLIEPLMHMVRNAIDHGIELPAHRLAAGKPETATLTLSARQHGGSLVVEVSDDGRGLDVAAIRRRAMERSVLPPERLASLGERELLNLIFLPGFSTASSVTELSGRGVGMDVVKTRISQVGGQVEVSTRPGQGTTFTLKLPLSAAIQTVILVAAGSREYALPERSVAEILSMPASSLQSVQGQACCLLRGAMLPVYGIGALLGTGGGAVPGKFAEIVVLTDNVHRIGLLVDRVVSRPEVFVREVHEDIAKLPGVGGVSILGSGQVVLILDGEKLLFLAQARAQSLRGLLRVS